MWWPGLRIWVTRRLGLIPGRRIAAIGTPAAGVDTDGFINLRFRPGKRSAFGESQAWLQNKPQKLTVQPAEYPTFTNTVTKQTTKAEQPQLYVAIATKNTKIGYLFLPVALIHFLERPLK